MERSNKKINKLQIEAFTLRFSITLKVSFKWINIGCYFAVYDTYFQTFVMQSIDLFDFMPAKKSKQFLVYVFM